ncbi:hypothetical protein GQ53DRAFT_83238 [Thozetella sp. PMI_491]|nr:hypothetical protein GQ53DRAFT_83238 [Thozetella sp. PMI_491]
MTALRPGNRMEGYSSRYSAQALPISPHPTHRHIYHLQAIPLRPLQDHLRSTVVRAAATHASSPRTLSNTAPNTLTWTRNHATSARTPAVVNCLSGTTMDGDIQIAIASLTQLGGNSSLNRALRLLLPGPWTLHFSMSTPLKPEFEIEFPFHHALRRSSRLFFSPGYPHPIDKAPRHVLPLNITGALERAPDTRPP